MRSNFMRFTITFVRGMDLSLTIRAQSLVM